MAYIHLYPPMPSWDIQEIWLKGNLQYTHWFDNLSEIYWKTPKSTGSSWFIISLLKDVRLVEFSTETPKYHVLICIVVTTCSPYNCPHQMSYVNSCPSDPPPPLLDPKKRVANGSSKQLGIPIAGCAQQLDTTRSEPERGKNIIYGILETGFYLFWVFMCNTTQKKRKGWHVHSFLGDFTKGYFWNMSPLITFLLFLVGV